MSLTDNLDHAWLFQADSHDAVGASDGADTNIVYPYQQGARFNGVRPVDATTSRITAANLLSGNVPAYSIAIWAKTSTSGIFMTQRNLVSTWGIIDFWMYTSGAIRFEETHQDGTMVVQLSSEHPVDTSDSRWADNSWHLFVAIKDQPNGMCYLWGDVNGVMTLLDSQACTLTGNMYADHDLLFGFDPNDFAAPLNGSLKLCFPWSRAITADEVTQLWADGAGLDPTDSPGPTLPAGPTISVKDSPFNAQGDGSFPDADGIQAAFDYMAATQTITKVQVPAGSYNIDHSVRLYNLQPDVTKTLEFVGTPTMIHNSLAHQGGSGNYKFDNSGTMLWVMAGSGGGTPPGQWNDTLGYLDGDSVLHDATLPSPTGDDAHTPATILNPAADTRNILSVSGSTITYAAPPPASYVAGARLFLNNGKGGTIDAITRLGITPGFYREWAPNEFVTIASVSGSVVTLTAPIIGDASVDYANIGTGDDFAQTKLIGEPAENIVIEGAVTITRNESSAIADILFAYRANNVSISGMTADNTDPATTTLHNLFDITESQSITITDCISAKFGTQGNSCRRCVYARNTLRYFDFEEGMVETICVSNTLVGVTSDASNKLTIRLGDRVCRRNIFANNVIRGGNEVTGAVGFAEGIGNVYANNSSPLAAQQSNLVWTQGLNNIFSGNTGATFSDGGANTVNSGNSWTGVIASYTVTYPSWFDQEIIMAKTTTFGATSDNDADNAANWDNGLPVVGDAAIIDGDVLSGTITANTLTMNTARIDATSVTLNVNAFIFGAIPTTFYKNTTLATAKDVRAGVANGLAITGTMSRSPTFLPIM